MGKKLLSLLLAVVMVVMVLPVTALAVKATDMTFTISANSEADVKDTVDVTVSMQIKGTADAAAFQNSFCTIEADPSVTLKNKDGSSLNATKPIKTISGTMMGFEWTGTAIFAKAGEYTITAKMMDANYGLIGTASCTIQVTARPVCPHSGTQLDYREYHAPTTIEAGWNAHTYCPECKLYKVDAYDGWFAKDSDEYKKYVEIEADPTLCNHAGTKSEYVDAEGASCDKDGWNAYQHCIVCDIYKTDDCDHWFTKDSADYQTYIVLKAAHTFDDAHTFEACTPGCVTNGLKEDCKQCIVCKQWFSDSHPEGMSNIDAIGALLIPATGHKLTTVGASDSNCEERGCVEHQHCSVCDKDFAMDAGKYNMHPLEDKDVYLELADHSMIFCEESNYNYAFWYCENCEKYFKNAEGSEEFEKDAWKKGAADENNKPEHLLLKHVEKVDATCTEDGNIEYWVCLDEGCGRYFKTERAVATDEIAATRVLLNALNHKNKIHVSDSATSIEHWHCPDCEKYFLDEDCTEEVSQEDTGKEIVSHEHKLNHHKETATSKEYWYCEECEKYFLDAEGTNEVSQGETGKEIVSHEHKLTHHKETATSKEYWYCEECEKYFLDADGANEVSQEETGKEIVSHEHKLNHHKETATSKEYWYCEECDKYFLDAEGTNEISQEETGKEIVSHEHKLNHHKETATSKEYWYCEECDKYFLDAEGTNEVSKEETGKDYPSSEHILIHHDAVPATCTEGGNTEYWECEDCHKYFGSADASTEVKGTDTILNALGHDMKHHEETATTRDYYYCQRCKLFFEDKDGEVQLSEDQIKNPQGPVFHHMNYVPAEEPTCQKTGCIEHYFCDECGKYYADPNGVEELKGTDVLLNTVDHDWSWIDEIAATADKDGCLKHAECGWCGMVKTEDHPDAFVASEHPEWLTIPASGGKDPEGGEGKPGETDCKHPSKIFRGQQAPTCTTDGRAAYNYCDDCHMYWNANGQVTTWEALRLNALGHNLEYVGETDTTVGYWRCTRCGMKFSDAEGKNPIVDITKPENPYPPVDPPVQESNPVIKDDLDITNMELSSILGKGRQP